MASLQLPDWEEESPGSGPEVHVMNSAELLINAEISHTEGAMSKMSNNPVISVLARAFLAL